MNREIVYPGGIPLDTDILSAQQETMKALGALVQATFGTSTFVDGLACTQTLVPGMSILVGQGWIGSLATVEPNAFGSLPADGTTPLMKMGINLQATTLGPLSAPATAGQSVVYLVQAAFSEADNTPVVLPYYNAANPAAPYTGPSNSGTAQNTKRAQTVTLGLVQGSAATTGSQTTPAPTSGYTGLYAITIANGQTTITAPNIAILQTAPFIDPLGLGRGVRPGRLLNVRVFSASGTYTPTVGMGTADVFVLGGGGASAGLQATTSTQWSISAGASSGAFARSRLSATAVGASQAVTVGLGGIAGTAGGGAGGNGGTSSFGALLSAGGGYGTSSQGPSAVAVYTASPPVSNATATGGNIINVSGVSGGFSIGIANVGASGGLGAASPLFGGQGPGSGGGGAAIYGGTGATIGNAGMAGMIIVMEYS